MQNLFAFDPVLYLYIIIVSTNVSGVKATHQDPLTRRKTSYLSVIIFPSSSALTCHHGNSMHNGNISIKMATVDD